MPHYGLTLVHNSWVLTSSLGSGHWINVLFWKWEPEAFIFSWVYIDRYTHAVRENHRHRAVFFDTGKIKVPMAASRKKKYLSTPYFCGTFFWKHKNFGTWSKISKKRQSPGKNKFPKKMTQKIGGGEIFLWDATTGTLMSATDTVYLHGPFFLSTTNAVTDRRTIILLLSLGHG